MSIDLIEILDLVLVVLTVKLIVSRYRPPIQESLQAIICIAIGVIISLIINPTVEGFITGVIGSGVAFYGGDLLNEFKTVKNEISDMDDTVRTSNDSMSKVDNK